MTKLCSLCKKPIARSTHANNVRYCHTCRKVAYKYTAYRSEWQRQKNDTKAKSRAGKEQCLICGLWYKKPLTHVSQRHSLTERQYKTAHGLDLGRGILAESTKQKLQEAVKDNFLVVVAQNLIQNGTKTRFKKSDTTLGKYERSTQTMQRLRKGKDRTLQNGLRFSTCRNL